MKRFLVTLFAIVIIICTSLSTHANNTTNISTSSLDYSSRYIFHMKSTNGNSYKIYIASPKESAPITSSWLNSSDKVFQGEYYAFLSKQNSDTAVLQSVYLFGATRKNTASGIFNLSDKSLKNNAFLVNGINSNPDILFISQQIAGGGDTSLRAFYIDNDKLKIIQWKNQDSQLLNSTYSAAVQRITYDSNGYISIPGWMRSLEYSGGTLTKWRFDPSQQICVFQEFKRIK